MMNRSNHTLTRRARPAAVPAAIVILIVLALSAAAQAVPAISIDAVETGKSVTISGAGFPANRPVNVYLGKNGTLGVNGTLVGETAAEADGVVPSAVYTIPASLAADRFIAVRLESPGTGFHAYDTFENAPPAALLPPNYAGFPTFTIVSVSPGVSVTIETANMPAGAAFTAEMYALRPGQGAPERFTVGEIAGDQGASFKATYLIPAELKDEPLIGLMLDGPGAVNAYNYFFNTETESTAVGPNTPYTGFPKVTTTSSVKDENVTTVMTNLPPFREIIVRMGPFGTAGVNGPEVGRFNSGNSREKTAVYNIPESLKGQAQIAIRIETADGYSAYDWFDNVTTP